MSCHTVLRVQVCGVVNRGIVVDMALNPLCIISPISVDSVKKVLERGTSKCDPQVSPPIGMPRRGFGN